MFFNLKRTVLENRTNTKHPTVKSYVGCRRTRKTAATSWSPSPPPGPGDVFEDVSLVQYATAEDGDAVEVKALSCSRGKWSESIIQYETDSDGILTIAFQSCESFDEQPRRAFVMPFVCVNRKKPCILPPYPARGTYLVIGKPGARPGDAFERADLHQYAFDESSGLYEVKEVTCASGIWYATHLKTNSDRLRNQTRCELPPYPQDGNNTVMHKPAAAPGAVLGAVHLSYSCYPNRKLVGSKNVYCIEGAWSDDALRCIQCGAIKPLVSESVSAEEAVRRELPWHVAIYDNTKSYEHICSGSILATNLIVTAAHCFFRDAEDSRLDLRFAVAAGKVYSDWNGSDDKDTQRSNVVEIIIHLRFRYSKSDLALVFLDTPLNYTDYVMSVCLNFDPKLDEKQQKDVKIRKVPAYVPRLFLISCGFYHEHEKMYSDSRKTGCNSQVSCDG
ncbi:Coagulation factor XI [Eumeta japonica]|uniref:Coagulation factor XI n=1 Tax=Eumeta variegata TaxID=151549 RepID=A0A4C1UWI0_EUMVA|nr:Coagulation factor XI [Eumeta japonica]